MGGKCRQVCIAMARCNIGHTFSYRYIIKDMYMVLLTVEKVCVGYM